MDADTIWAIRQPVLIDLAKQTQPRADDADLPAIEALISRHGLVRMDGTIRAAARDSVGVLPVIGPIVSMGQWMRLARDFTAMIDDRDITAVVLSFDTPGGILPGTQEFSDLVYQARADKPVVAYIGAMAASAGYYVASAASEIVISESGEAGGIGVVASYVDWSKFDERLGIQQIDVVSSQSPRKRLPPTTQQGRDLLQSRVDQQAEIFFARVARNRGVSRATVVEKFGQGDVLVGKNAVQAGLADRIGNFDDALSITPATRERHRVSALMGMSRPGCEDVVAKAIEQNWTPEQTAAAVLRAVKDRNIAPAAAPAAPTTSSRSPWGRAVSNATARAAGRPAPGRDPAPAWGKVIANATERFHRAYPRPEHEDDVDETAAAHDEVSPWAKIAAKYGVESD